MQESHGLESGPIMSGQIAMDGSVLFVEVQRFRQVWVWFFILLASASAWLAFLTQFVVVRGSRGSELGLAIFFALIGIALPAFFYLTNLKVEVKSDGIHVGFFPVLWRTIAFWNIKACDVRKYNAIWDYGGWGIRGRSRNDRAYTVSGDMGVQLKLVDGRKVLLGSQRAEELARVIQKAMKEQGEHLV